MTEETEPAGNARPQSGDASSRRPKSRSRTRDGARRAKTTDPESNGAGTSRTPARSAGQSLDAAAFLADGLVAPEGLMDNFSRNRMGRGVTVSVILHLVVVGLFSLGFLYTMVGGDADTRTDEERAQQAEAELQKSLRSIANKHGVPVQDLLRQVAPPIPQAPSVVADAPAREDLMRKAPTEEKTPAPEDRVLTPVEKRITDTAAPDEIPDRPDVMDDLLEGM